MIANIVPLKGNSAADCFIGFVAKQNMEKLAPFCSEENLNWTKNQLSKDCHSVQFNEAGRQFYIELLKEEKDLNKSLEGLRTKAAGICKQINAAKLASAELKVFSGDSQETWAAIEGLLLSNYQFLKYKSEKKPNSLNEISSSDINEKEAKQLSALVEATYIARDLVNEPHSFLNASQYSAEIEKMAQDGKFNVTVLRKGQIESLKMGGLLAVNKGSIQEPTFNIIEYKPANAINEKPIIFVGKGVMYDTGGLSLKPTGNSMDFMKSDMGGAAATTGAIYAAAKADLPLHIITLVPATDNRPGGDAYAPGDVITMMSGTTVEVLNTDAEGRMVLADALHYAKRFDPEIVMDLATLTGAAVRAFGTIAISSMGTDEAALAELQKCGMQCHERTVVQPFWDDYGTWLDSSIADMTNLGPSEAGDITAGKFLEKFTDYPWVHMDIAGPAFLHKEQGYRLKGGTGVGVRLLFQYLLNRID
jgi:leucyl aminopeptidase